MKLVINFIAIMVGVISLSSCCNKEKVEQYYVKNKALSDTMFVQCMKLNVFSKRNFVFRKTGMLFSKQIEIRIFANSVDSSGAIYFTPKGKYLDVDRVKSFGFYSITESQEFKQVLELFIESDYQTIDTESWGEGVFLGKCNSMKMKKGELGIKYFNNPEGVVENKYRKKIDDNVYVEHSIVP